MRPLDRLAPFRFPYCTSTVEKLKGDNCAVKKYYYPLPRPTDPEKIAQGSYLKRDMARLMDNNDEEGYIGYVKAMYPNFGKTTLDWYRQHFREQRDDRKRNGSRIRT
jgi:hypothetical protein